MRKVFSGRFGRAVAAVLSVAMVMGSTGCDVFGVRKGKAVMNDRLINFNKALNELDYEAVRDLSDWTEKDSDYTAIETLFDTSYYGDAAEEGLLSCTEYIASTISIRYDIETVQIQYYQASLDVEYEMVDWKQVYQKPHSSYAEVLEDLKNCPDKITVGTAIVFENMDLKNSDWRLCRINKIGEVMSFIHTSPEIVQN